MLEQTYNFTGKDLVKLSIMIVLATLLFGFPGLIIILIFQWITYKSYAFEPANKHGISQVGASRLGGAAVLIISLALYVLGSFAGFFDFGNRLDIPVIGFVTVILCMLIGLIDDLKNNLLSPKIRLLSTAFIFSLCLGLWPSLIPKSLGIFALDILLQVSVIGWFLAVVFCVGFINSINMADGANGLIPGMLTVAFIVFYLETEFLVFAILMVSCGLFSLFNIISGRLFLGDAGAYGLGSVLVLSGLYMFTENIFSASFLSVLFAYPCIDILVTVARRRIGGTSILLPDNNHLHNRLHFHCQRWFRSETLANSITGILIVSCSSGLALFGFINEWWPNTSNQWAWIFLAQNIAYCLIFILTGFNRSSNEFVKSS